MFISTTCLIRQHFFDNMFKHVVYFDNMFNSTTCKNSCMSIKRPHASPVKLGDVISSFSKFVRYTHSSMQSTSVPYTLSCLTIFICQKSSLYRLSKNKRYLHDAINFYMICLHSSLISSTKLGCTLLCFVFLKNTITIAAINMHGMKLFTGLFICIFKSKFGLFHKYKPRKCFLTVHMVSRDVHVSHS